MTTPGTNDRVAFGITAVAVALAAAVGALEPWVAVGPPVLDELPTSWTPRLAPRTSAEVLPDGRVALRVRACEADCRAVIERPVPLEGGPWLVTGEVVRGKPGKHARLYVDSAADVRYFGREPAVGPERAIAVVDEPISGVATVGAVVAGPWGELDVGRITVAPARRSVLRIVLFGSASVAFLAAAIHAGLWVVRALGGRARVAAAVVGTALVAGVLMPARWLDALLLAIVPGSTADDLGGHLLRDPSAPVLVQKFGGHGGGFLLLGLLAGVSGAPAGVVLARLAAFALATEAVQVLIPGRSAQPADFGIDLVAATLGLAIASFVRAAPRAPPPSAASPP